MISGGLMDATTATLAGATIAASVALAGYVLNQRAQRTALRARMFADALQSVRQLMELPYLVWRRSDTSAVTVETLGRTQSQVVSNIRFHLQLLEIECPRVSRAFYLLQLRARGQAAANRDLAWREPLTGSSKPVWADPDFRYDVAPETALCIAAMRAQNSFFGRLRRKGLEQQCELLEHRDSLDLPAAVWFRPRSDVASY